MLPNRGLLEHGASTERVYREIVAPALDQFVSKPAFEEICRGWVLERVNSGEWPGVDRVGAWWGPLPDPTPNQPRRQTEGELEIVAAAGNRVVLAGEAKWTRRPVGLDVLSRLQRVVRHLPGADEHTALVIFARAFEPRLEAAARREGIRLVSAAALYP